MIIYYLLGFVILLSLGVIGYIFILLKKESAGPNEVKIEPLVISKQSFEPMKPGIDSVNFKELEYRQKIEELENEVKGLSEKLLSQAQESVEKKEPFVEENQNLKEELTKQVEMYAKQFNLAQEQMQEINNENNSLKSSLQEKSGKIAALELAIEQSKGQMEFDLAQARNMVEQLKSERDVFMSNREASLLSVQTLTREFEELKKSYEQLMAESNETREYFHKLKELNKILSQKNEMVQNELIKYRAQASGLEQICENYKEQLAGRI